MQGERQQRGAERAAEMRPPLAPVQAGKREASPEQSRGLDVNPERLQSRRSGDRTGHVVVAGARGPQAARRARRERRLRRVSVGSLLSRVALGAFLRAASEMRGHGTFSFAGEAVPYRDLNEMFE